MDSFTGHNNKWRHHRQWSPLMLNFSISIPSKTAVSAEGSVMENWGSSSMMMLYWLLEQDTDHVPLACLFWWLQWYYVAFYSHYQPCSKNASNSRYSSLVLIFPFWLVVKDPCKGGLEMVYKDYLFLMFYDLLWGLLQTPALESSNLKHVLSV